MIRPILFTALGYCSGSLLFARYFGQLLMKKDVAADSPDGNPGAFNAFRYGGVACGVLTLLCDLLKGFLPVFFYLHGTENTADTGMWLALVLAAPVFGHIFPLFHRFQGGKGIAVSFGCLLGLLPEIRPVLILAVVFLFFSLIVNITPNWHKTLCTYLAAAAGMLLFAPNAAIGLGFALIASLVIAKLLRTRPEHTEQYEVKPAWKH